MMQSQAATDLYTGCKRVNDSQHNIFLLGHKVSMIQLDMVVGKWVYERTGFSSVFFEDCVEVAREDIKKTDVVTVVQVRLATAKPTYLAKGWGNWKQHGSGNSCQVTVVDEQGEFTLWVPVGFAESLSAGDIAELRHDAIDGPFLREIPTF
ncbi:MAG: hypothetical protein AAGA46_00180 [Cyanobacteria bacterium P01_F01_bin.13]